MALKSKKYAVQHFILSDDLPKLNEYVSNFVNSGFTILDAKLINADYYNKIYTVFYILAKQLEITEE